VVLLVRKRYLFLLASVLLLMLSAFLTRFALVKIEKAQASPEVHITVDFMFPMRKIDLNDHLKVEPELPNSPLRIETSWLNGRTLLITIRETGCPVGQKLNFSLRAPTVLPLVEKRISETTRCSMTPKILLPKTAQKVPTKGPIVFQFNTLIDQKSMAQSFRSGVSGRIEPVKIKIGESSHYDYSRWQFFPDKPLVPGTDYAFTLTEDLCSAGGIHSAEDYEVTVTGAEAPKLLGVTPANGAHDVRLFQPVEAEFDNKIGRGEILVTDPQKRISVPGDISVEGNTIEFSPTHCFLPDSTYRVEIEVLSDVGEPAQPYTSSFQTVSLGDRKWVDVKLGDIHSVTVYEGRMPVRTMVASGGRAETETPMGTFFTQDRGKSFWSPRFGEGATYWVRLVDQILVHSVPKDVNWETKAEEHMKLGLPASHGCIRLSEQDAKWFFENVPRGTTVIIHP